VKLTVTRSSWIPQQAASASAQAAGGRPDTEKGAA
jgi:hypothetical protein